MCHWSLKEARYIHLKWKACRSQMQMQLQMQISNGKHADVTTMWLVISSDWIDSPQSQNVNYKIQNTIKKIKEWKDKKKPIYDDLVISHQFWLDQQSSLRNTKIQTKTYKRGNKIIWEYCRFQAYLNILGKGSKKKNVKKCGLLGKTSPNGSYQRYLGVHEVFVMFTPPYC